MTDKHWIERWTEYLQMLETDMLAMAAEDPSIVRKRRERLEADAEQWFKYYFPRYAYAPPAEFHKDATRRVIEHPEWCEVRMWSRELAKSTRTMMEVFYLVFVGHKCGGKPRPAGSGKQPGQNKEAARKRCVLLVSNSLDNACRLLAPYKNNLESNRRLIQDYGPQVGYATWSLAEFVTLGGVSFRAIGAGQSPRGTRNEEARPDLILFDDLDTDADCLNAEIVAKKWRWVEEAAIGTRSVSQTPQLCFAVTV